MNNENVLSEKAVDLQRKFSIVLDHAALDMKWIDFLEKVQVFAVPSRAKKHIKTVHFAKEDSPVIQFKLTLTDNLNALPYALNSLVKFYEARYKTTAPEDIKERVMHACRPNSPAMIAMFALLNSWEDNEAKKLKKAASSAKVCYKCPSCGSKVWGKGGMEIRCIPCEDDFEQEAGL